MVALKKLGVLLLVLAIAGAAIYDAFVTFGTSDTVVPGLATIALALAAIPTEIRLIKYLAK